MKYSKKIKILFLVGTSIFCGSLFTTAEATNTLLSRTELILPSINVTAELWGNRLKNGYAKDLLILLKDNNKVFTAYNPSIDGGYNCYLLPVQVKDTTNKNIDSLGQQLLLSAGQGDWHADTEYRILDFTDVKNVREIFNSTNSMGIITQADVKENILKMQFIDGQKNEVQLEDFNNFGRQKLRYGGLFSLTPYDIDGDGQQELFTVQQIKNGHHVLADIGAVWHLDQGKNDKAVKNQEDVKTNDWKYTATTVMLMGNVDKNNIINNGKHISYGSILPKKMLIPGGEATYPIFVSSDISLQKKVNNLLAEESKNYLQKFYNNDADMAFKVVRNDSKLLTVQLISGKEYFNHHNINIDPVTGELVDLAQIIDINNHEVQKLLRVLSTNDKIVFAKGIQYEWSIEGNNLFLIQNIDGKEEIAGFAIGNLQKYILDKKWLK